MRQGLFAFPDERNYAAGFFDGEGCISFHSLGDRVRVYVIIVNTDLAILEWFRQRWGGSIRPRKRYQQSHRQAYKYVPSPQLGFLEDLAPLLIVKRERALEALAILRLTRGRVRRQEAA